MAEKSIEQLFGELVLEEEAISARHTEVAKHELDHMHKLLLLDNIIREHEAKAIALREEMLALMEADGLVETQIFMFKVRRKKSAQKVIIEDESKISGNYIITKTPKATTAPDKVTIGKLLRAGHEIAGARLSDEKYELEIKGK